MEENYIFPRHILAYVTKGRRKFLEDLIYVYNSMYESDPKKKHLLVGVFDGHCGSEVVDYVRNNLLIKILHNEKFHSDMILQAITEAFSETQKDLVDHVGELSSIYPGKRIIGGTTASVMIFKDGKMYIGYVGDSRIVLGYQKPGEDIWCHRDLTRDHKPNIPAEKERIEKAGGSVVNKRVVWNSLKNCDKEEASKEFIENPTLNMSPDCDKEEASKEIIENPTLNMSRALGDLWSYNPATKEYIISPQPEVLELAVDPETMRCVLIASDGLWNSMSSSQAISFIQSMPRDTLPESQYKSIEELYLKSDINPSKQLVREALKINKMNHRKSDNIAVLCILW